MAGDNVAVMEDMSARGFGDPVDFGLTSGECPASKLGAAAQFLNALAYTADVYAEGFRALLPK